MDNLPKPQTLRDLISEGLEKSKEEDMKAIFRENTRKLEAQQDALERRVDKMLKPYQSESLHYKNMDVEPWDVVDTWPIEQQIGAHRHNLLKYTMRLGSKDERLKEAKKIRDYADKLIEVLEREALRNK
jgi:hypothetical protein